MQSDRNIQLGSAYLRQLLNRFDEHQVLATAAYNAGPHRVTRWLPTKGTLPADQWVDTIPFAETRRYVRSVMAYTAIFEWKLNDKPTQLKHRMLPVKTRQITAKNSEI
jgi:soluble lytic murein transglycosylase